jgi:predicted dehydrogenase/threonine dehydrogenase-like Zn-dependent dehydrogenase
VKQILQSLRTGVTELADVPAPGVRYGHALIRTSRSLVSAGTERMLVDFGKAGLISKALQQPEKVRMAYEKARTDGVVSTIEAVFNKLDQPLPLGYCNVGTVMGVGGGTTILRPGDRVASNGRHADIVNTPFNLCAAVPAGVSDDEASFTVLGAIALQGIRLVQPTLGETVMVTGLGLVGLLTVQLLRAHGCRVLGSDFDPERLRLARRFGAEIVDLATGQDPVAAAEAHTRGRGVDAVIITASTSKSEPVAQAARMSRKRGRIVLVGVTGLRLSRADFYEKELTFQVSCSYGPGRHDPSYEDRGNDYPLGFVRWTEQRNFEAVLDMMADGRLDVKPLVSHRFPIEEAERAYALITGDEPSMGVLLEYPAQSAEVDPRRLARVVDVAPARTSRETLGVGFLGAGNYACAALIPAFRDAGVRLRTVVSATGVTGFHAARRFGFEVAATDADAVLGDPAIDAVVIATRHDSHGELVCRALAAGKHVFVEKPLALRPEEVDAIERELVRQGVAGRSPVLTVGFNRRFAPHVRRMAELLAGFSGPVALVMTVNAGAIPAAHWTRDAVEGGGRIAGEACHFIDLLRFLSASEIVDIRRMPLAMGRDESAAIHLQFASGSTGVVHYLCQGAKSFPKERLEVFGADKVLQLDNFRTLRAFGIRGAGLMRFWRQDKGQRPCVRAFVDAAMGRGPVPIPLDQLLEVARATIAAARRPALSHDGLA